MVSNTAQNDLEQGFWIYGWMEIMFGKVKHQICTLGLPFGNQRTNLIFTSSWWGDIVGYEWHQDHMKEFWRSDNDDIVSEQLVLLEPQPTIETISGVGFYTLP